MDAVNFGLFITVTVIARDYGRLEISFPFFVTQFRTQSATFISERVMHGEFRINMQCVLPCSQNENRLYITVTDFGVQLL
jgi:hypothetical protein